MGMNESATQTTDLKNVLVIGATGELGHRMVSALLDNGKKVSILLRSNPERTAERQRRVNEFVKQGVTITEGGLSDEIALQQACAGVDAIISCVDARPPILRAQENIIAAAQLAGTVKRIIPSQFGVDSRMYVQGRVDHGDTKRQMQALFGKSGIPVTYVHANGLASAWAASLGDLGLLAPPQHEVKVYGTGEVKAAIVTTEDVARYTVRALDDLSAANRHVTTQPPENLYTQNELVALWEAKSKQKLRRITISPEELDARIEALAEDKEGFGKLARLQLIRALWIDGLAAKRSPDALEATELWPNMQYHRIPDYLDGFMSAAKLSLPPSQ
jgi:uncharacterized protein YbjT (DUF2867 family)